MPDPSATTASTPRGGEPSAALTSADPDSHPATPSEGITVDIAAAGKLGLSLGPKTAADGEALEVLAVAPGGLADVASGGRVRPGMVVAAVMGKPTAGVGAAGVMQLIKAAGRPLSLAFAAPPGAPEAAARPPVGAGLHAIGELPSAVQLQIAALTTAAAPTAAKAEPPFTPARSTGYNRYDALTQPLADERRCFAVADGFVSAALAAELRTMGGRMDDAGELRPAGVGTGPTRRQDAAARGDRIAWLPSATEEFPLSILLRQFAALRDALAGSAPRWAPMRGGEIKCMLACYPTGSRYVKHRDTSPLCPDRIATAILYLNADWAPGDGGELAIHPDDGSGSSTVAPAAGRLVVFDSRTEHEVLEFRGRERWAITGFLYRAETAVSPPPSHGPKILVAIASYRDEECAHTIDALYASAKTPQRVSVAVLDQSEPADGDCVSAEAREKFGAQIGVHRMHWSKAKGPCWARAMLQQCLEGEGFYLQIDSHMRFVEDWDALLLKELYTCPGCPPEKAILSTYPLGYNRPNQLPAHRLPTLLCADGFRHEDAQGTPIPPSLRLRARVLLVPPREPVPSLFWAAGFSFSSSEAAIAVPYDDSLEFLFFGEESSMAARYWTHGYSIFAPTQAVVFHLWDRSYRPSFREIPDQEAPRSKSEKAVAGLLGVAEPEPEPEPEPQPESEVEAKASAESSRQDRLSQLASATPVAGLGSVRTLQEFSEHCGVDFGNAVMTPQGRARFGGQDPTVFVPDDSETEGGF